MTNSLLTVCLPTTPDRRGQFYLLLEEILKQINECGASELIEILIDEDCREKSIGRKRDDLLKRATGRYICGVDSDDFIHPKYIYEIVNALLSNPDTHHVGFYERCDINGVMSNSIFSIRYKNWAENTDGFDHIRCANPKSVILREKALEVGYDDLRFSEDRVFSEKVTPLLESEVFIEKQLYYYNYKSSLNSNERYGIK